jgi:hypothetical protein
VRFLTPVAVFWVLRCIFMTFDIYKLPVVL